MVKSREQKKISLLWHTGNKKDNKACDTKPNRQHHVLQEFNMGRIVEVLEGIYKKAVFDTVHWFIETSSLFHFWLSRVARGKSYSHHMRGELQFPKHVG